jgi:hypothetical protein
VRHPILGIAGAKPRLSTLLKAEAAAEAQQAQKRKPERKKRKGGARKSAKAARLAPG